METERMWLVYTTLPKEKAKEFAKRLVEEGLAVCTNLVPVESFYIWKGKLEEGKEVGCLAKVIDMNSVEKIREMHPYELPFIGVMEIEANREYVEWGKGLEGKDGKRD